MLRTEISVEKIASKPVWELPDGWYEVVTANRWPTGIVHHKEGDVVLKSNKTLANITQSLCEQQWWEDWDETSPDHPGDGKGGLYLTPLLRTTKVRIIFE